MTSLAANAEVKQYELNELPTLFFGRKQRLAYALNPKSACTLALNFMFYLNNGYRYFDPIQIHYSPRALMKLNFGEPDARAVAAFSQLSPQSFSFVRDPVKRLVSGFLSKVFSDDDPHMRGMRDFLTSECGIDLSPEADPAKSCVAFANWIAMQPDLRQIDRHFRPQWLNLRSDSRYTVNTILRLEDKEAMNAFFKQWLGAEKAAWFLSFKFNEHTQYKHEQVVSDELKSIVKKIYAKDYELFYA